MKVLENMDVDISESGANRDILEQVALVRNRIQHPDHITSLNVTYSKSDLKKHPHPFFVDKEHYYQTEEEGEISWLMPPPISATREKVFEAIENVESFCTWLERIFMNRDVHNK